MSLIATAADILWLSKIGEPGNSPSPQIWGDLESPVRRALFLTAPHRGVEFARIMVRPSSREFGPGEKLQRQSASRRRLRARRAARPYAVKKSASKRSDFRDATVSARTRDTPPKTKLAECLKTDEETLPLSSAAGPT